MDPTGSQTPAGGAGGHRIRRQSSRPSVGIRQSSAQSIRNAARVAPTLPAPQQQSTTNTVDFAPRRRSSSEPRPIVPVPALDDSLARSQTRTEGVGDRHMPTLNEENSPVAPVNYNASVYPVVPNAGGRGATETNTLATAPHAQNQSMGSRALDGMGRSYLNRRRARAGTTSSQPEYDHELVNLLDVVDPEVSTLSTLTNVQNSLFVPDLGSWINRRPTYNLSAMPPRLTRQTTAAEDKEIEGAVDDAERLAEDGGLQRINSSLSDSRYAVLPHGVRLDGWTDEEKEELNDHVRHMLHSRRAAFKRSMKGFKQYVKRPLGFFVTLYAFLITVFGFTWVLFLIGWVSLGARRDYVINVIDNVLVALFAVMGDGLIPWRTVDTYHMIYIAHYHHLTWKLRKKQRLAKLPDHNDLPTRISMDVNRTAETADLEAARSAASSVYGHEEYFSVLTPEQQRKLEHHQTKFAKSHTFYKPHETETHYAFPLRLLVAIVVLLDFHSIFQIALGTTTWAISYHVRPFALTTVILCCSLACNITGGILISVGDKRTRKKEVRERMFRQELTDAAIKKVEKERRRREEEEGVNENALMGIHDGGKKSSDSSE
ncbi:hypothetical protein C1H76_0650 [Elsinoe australis]|uniref:Integral membrane protein n=1 Tax=Elsinoe australis TaxID=40998 RepID=A0A4U7B6M1_9PEZI|nr:hypothetical protein C1H76_0650 [Elsinoe australis]